jgi:hypothetical protein
MVPPYPNFYQYTEATYARQWEVQNGGHLAKRKKLTFNVDLVAREFANRLASTVPTIASPQLQPPIFPPRSAVPFHGKVIAVKARIRLLRSFDQISHQYLGYTLVISPTGMKRDPLRIAVGPVAHATHQFRIGDIVSGKAHEVAFPHIGWAGFYKASGLKVERRGPAIEDRPADPDGGSAPSLDVYRDSGHRRLDSRTCQTKCQQCPWGLTMTTEIIIDQWNPARKTWRFETHCYGPRDCPRYRAGAARKVPGRTPGMVWIDNDVEREAGV